MNNKNELNRKKIIAREFLLLVACLIISGIAFIGSFPYNYTIKSKKDKLEKNIILFNNEIDLLEHPINDKLLKQEWFCNEIYKRGALGVYRSYSELWERLEYLQKSDSIVFKWNNKWNIKLIKLINEIGFKSAQDFDNFINDNTITADELLNITKADSIRAEVANIQSHITSKEFKILDINDQLNFALLFLAIALIIAFPIRYLFYSAKWSIKTLKQKE